MSDEDDFQPKLGKIRARGGTHGRRYVQQVLRAAALAGGKALARSSGKRRFDGSRIGRGAGAGRVLRDRHAAFRSRRVVIKTRIVKIGARGLKAAKLHLRYIQRDGVTREGTPGELYDATQDRADGKAFLERSDGDRHQFRFIIAAEDAVEYEELKGFTRRFMARMEQDLGTKLDWVAVDHFNTGHPHTHVILRGKDENGQDLVIARDYIAHGMRERASEIVTLDLGPHTDLEIERKLTGEIEQDRLTNIDRRLIREAGEGGAIDIRQMPAGEHGRFQQTLRVGRLQHLKRLGVAEETSPGVWRLSGDIKATLQRLGERGDIIKMMHRAMTQARIERAPADYAIYDPAAPNARLVGRVVERGLSDELHDRHYLIVDGIDGRSHWVDLGAGEAIEPISAGTVVAVKAKRAEPKLADRTVADIAEQHGGRYSAEIHRRHDPGASGAYVAAYVRRLEALRRANVVERAGDGSWRIPSDFIKAVEAHERVQSRHAPVAVEVVSTTPVPQLIWADAETWLDRELVAEDPSSVRDAGFGHDVKGALVQRRLWLIEQGLAEERQDQVVYRANLLAILRRRELTRVVVQVSGELGLPYAEAGEGKRIEGTYRRRLDLVSGRFAVIERARDFTLVPWRPVLDRVPGKAVAGIVKGNAISWSIGRRRSMPSIS
ncbi:MAG: relaxase/mobilization nuclease RlxS [Micropepsaceae bacterium]